MGKQSGICWRDSRGNIDPLENKTKCKKKRKGYTNTSVDSAWITVITVDGGRLANIVFAEVRQSQLKK